MPGWMCAYAHTHTRPVCALMCIMCEGCWDQKRDNPLTCLSKSDGPVVCVHVCMRACVCVSLYLRERAF